MPELLLSILLIGQVPPGFEWRVTEVQQPRRPLAKVAQAVRRPRVVFLTLPGCIPCEHAKRRLAALDRSGLDWYVEDLQAWNARVPEALRRTTAPTVFVWSDPDKPGVWFEGDGITIEAVRKGLGRRVIRAAARVVVAPVRAVKATVQATVQATPTHMQRMKAKYGWIPSRHCGRRGCSMCDEIFGPQPARSRRRLFNRFGSVTPKFLPKYEDFNPTPMLVIKEAVKLAGLTAADTFVDLGCGDGRMLAAGFAAGAGRGIGVERNPKTAMLAHENTLAHDCEIIVGDISDGSVDLTGKKVFVYLYPKALEKIPNLDRAKMVVSFCHRPPQLPDAREVELFVDDGDPFTVFVWEPA